MKPADVMTISMNAKQADEVLLGKVELRTLALDFARQLLHKEPTPAQAQAALVLAWDEILLSSRLTSRED